jgi:hypothetical protein
MKGEYEKESELMKWNKARALLREMLGASLAGRGFLWVCLLLALAGTFSAAYPVTAVVVPASLLAPGRWRQISVVTALGSALGATLLVILWAGARLTSTFRSLSAMPAGARSWRGCHVTAC